VPTWLLTGALALVLLCAWPPRNTAAYCGVTTLDYGGQLTGYAATHKDDWDPDMDAYCTWWDWHPWYGWWCYVYSQYVYGVGVQHQLTTPSGAVQQGAAGSSTARFIRLDLAPHPPTEYGTWTHHGVYQAVGYEWQYWWNDWTQTYEEYYIGEWSNAFGEGWAQVVVPEPPPSISGLNPDAGPVGTLVGITGSSFGSNQGTVTFHNGVGAPVFNWTPTSIQVSVPDGAVTGPVVVTRAGGPSSTTNPTFTVTPPPASPESVHYVHLDALGSVRMITDAAGEVVGRSNFVPFGQDWEPSGVQEDRRFALLERTAETGGGSWLALDYAGARYYHSQTGRFTSPDDPIFGDPFDPQSMNLYAYALNNPLRFIDPSGQRAECPASTDTEVYVCAEAPDVGLLRFIWDSFGRQATGPPEPETGSDDRSILERIGLTTVAEARGARPIPRRLLPPGRQPNRIYSRRELIRRAQEVRRLSGRPGPAHNFPESFNQAIFEKGTQTRIKDFWIKPGGPLLSNDSIQYRLSGSLNGVSGTYEIFTRPSWSGHTEIIMHRFFRPD
jgi:RHS repeat-associated protein